jgi:hypothetical protein
LVIGDDRRTGLRTTGIGQDFRVVGSRLVPVLDVDGESSLARTTFITTSSDAVQLRLPSGYRAARSDSADDPPYFTLFEWVDDDTVALARGNTRTHYGDILVCHLPEGRCDVAVEAPQGDAIRLVVGGHLPG